MITDLWFVSGASLEAIAAGLGLVEVDPDVENYWEWVVGTLPEAPGLRIDITRTHTVPAGETDTRIFIWAGPPIVAFPDELVELLATRLRAMGITPVHAGQWNYRRGQEFDRVIERTLA